MTNYLLTSERLGLRAWRDEDLDDFQLVNGDPEVMKYFSRTSTREETKAQIARYQTHQREHGFCYFAAELLATGEFIGFVGLARQDYPADFTPCVDIGWRLKQSAWGNGYATEGALTCLDFARETLQVPEVYAVAVEQNLPSIRVMEKAGLEYHSHFYHPKLVDYPAIQRCVAYRIEL